MTDTETNLASTMPAPTPQKKASTAATPLPEDYSPSPTTVIVGRGKKVKRHPGNCNLTAMVISELAEYAQAEKTAKSFILMRVVKRIRDMNPDKVAFVKQDPKGGRWMSLPVSLARNTIAQNFRDALHATYRSSKHSKQRRRMQMQEKGFEMLPTSTEASSAAYPHTECRAMAGDGDISLLSSLAQGFEHSRTNSQISHRESLDRIRSLIHVPARRVSYMPEEMVHQRGIPYGYGRPAGYDASVYRSNQMIQGYMPMPPNMPSMYSMSMYAMRHAPMMDHYQLPLEDLPMNSEPASAVLSNSGVYHDSAFDTIPGSEDPFFCEDDYDYPLDLMAFHELPVSDVQEALHINPTA